MPKIFVSTFPFGISDNAPRRLLEDAKWDVNYNPFTRKLKPEELAEFAKDSDGVIAGTENIDKLLSVNPRLQFVSRVGIGLDSVPLQKCRERGIRVSYTPDAVTPAVAELTLGLMIALTRFVNKSDRQIRNNQWTRPVGKRIQNSKIGVVGFGRVGQMLVRLLFSLQPKEILVNDIRDLSNELVKLRKELNLSIREATQEEIFRTADVVSLHLPLYSKTKNMINEESLNLFNKDTFLINTARGELVQEEALYKALAANKIAGAALDVFKEEPYFGKLRELENVILTEHIGSCSFDCRYAMELQATEELIRFFRKEPLLREVPEEEYKYQL